MQVRHGDYSGFYKELTRHNNRLGFTTCQPETCHQRCTLHGRNTLTDLYTLGDETPPSAGE